MVEGAVGAVGAHSETRCGCSLGAVGADGCRRCRTGAEVLSRC